MKYCIFSSVHFPFFYCLLLLFAVGNCQNQWNSNPWYNFQCDLNMPFVSNGRIEGYGYSTVGTQRSITCDSGFQIEGPDFIYCQLNRQWSLPGRCVPAGIYMFYYFHHIFIMFLFPWKSMQWTSACCRKWIRSMVG